MTDPQLIQLRDSLTVEIDHTIYDAGRSRADAVASLQHMRALVERLIENTAPSTEAGIQADPAPDTEVCP